VIVFDPATDVVMFNSSANDVSCDRVRLAYRVKSLQVLHVRVLDLISVSWCDGQPQYTSL
jgi:hypothetical protein